MTLVSWVKPEEAKQWQVTFGAKVRHFRRQAGLTQEDLGKACDLSVAYLSSVELGHRNVSLVNIYVLALGLRVRPGELLEELPRP